MNKRKYPCATFACLLLALCLTLGLAGCKAGELPGSSSPQEVELEIGQSRQPPETQPPDAAPEEPPGEDGQNQEPAPGAEQERPSQEAAGQDQPQETKPAQGSCPLEEQPHLLCVLPAQQLSPNPNQVEEQGFAVLWHLVNGAFQRPRGVIWVRQQDGQGENPSLQELDYDITAALDSDGNPDPKAEIEADLQTVRSLSASGGYGSSSREVYQRYSQFAQALELLRGPLLGEGLTIQNLTGISWQEEGELLGLTGTYSPQALLALPEEERPGQAAVTAWMDRSGQLDRLELEYRSPQGDWVVLRREYRFG